MPYSPLSLPPVFQKALDHQLFQIISHTAGAENARVFLIGGYVRDLFLHRVSKDVDIVVDGDGLAFAEKVAARMKPRPTLSLFKTFGTAQLLWNDWVIEFVGARKESYTPDSRKPEVSPGSLEDDQRRRDFTINALAIDLHPDHFGTFHDPFNGIQDIHDQVLRTPLEPEITFSDDPLRMMRAVRFASQLGFSIAEETQAALSHNAHRLEIVSKERIAEELNKIILSPTPSIGFKLLFDHGLLHRFFPEMVALQGVEKINGLSHKDNFYHTLQVLDQICTQTDDLWLRWAAILHDIAKPITKRFEPQGFTFHGHEDKGARMVKGIFKNLKLPLNEKMEFVAKMVLLHLRPKALAESPQSTDSGYRRLIVEAGDDLESLFILCWADITSKNREKVQLYRQNLEDVRQRCHEVAERDQLRNWQPPIDGHHIMKTFHIQPGPMVGIIKDTIREAILEGEIPNDFDHAFQLMLKVGESHGLDKIS